MLMPTDGTSIWTATTSSGNGVAVGSGVALTVGSTLGTTLAGAADRLGARVVVGWMVALGRAIGGRLAAGSSPRPTVPAIMSAAPATPRMIGSAQEDRRFTWPSLAAIPTGRWSGLWPLRPRPWAPHPPG